MKSKVRNSKENLTKQKRFYQITQIVIGLLAFSSHAGATNFHWDGPWGGSWSASANWIPSGVPTTGDTVTVDGYIVAGGDSVSLAELNLSGEIAGMGDLSVQTFNCSGGTLRANSFHITNAASLTGLNLHSPAFTFDSSLSYSGGGLYGNLFVPSGATLILPSGQTRLGTASTITNNGSVLMSGGVLEGYDECIINNIGTWTLNGSIIPFTNFYGDNIFNNSGLLLKNGSTDTTELSGDWTYNLPGDTRCDAGELQFKAPVAVPHNATFSGTSTIRIASSTTTLGGTLNESIVSLILDGGTLTAAASAAIQGNLEWQTGNITGTLTIPSGATLQVTGSGSRRMTTATSIENHGTFLYQATSAVEAYDDCSFVNQAGGVIDCAIDGDPFSEYYDSSSLTNYGTIRKSAGAGTLQLNNWTTTHLGTIDVQSGIILLDGVWNLENHSIIQGVGEVHLNGDIFLNGSVTQNATALRFLGNDLTCSNPCSIVGLFDWEAGSLTGHLTVPSGSLLDVSGAGFKRLKDAAVIDIAGTYRWSGPSSVEAYSNNLFNILPGGLCDLAADGQPFSRFYEGSQLVNAGLLNKSTGAGGSTVCDSLIYHQKGDVSCSTSTLELQGTQLFEETSTITGSGEVLINGTTELEGTVDILAPTTWSAGSWTGLGGTVTGHLVWTGGYAEGHWTIGADSTLEIQEGAGATKRFESEAELQVAGEILFSSGTIIGYNNLVRIVILNGGLFHLNGNCVLDDFYTYPTVEIQSGGLLETSVLSDTTMTWKLDNDGTVSIPNGLLILDGGGESSGLFESTGTGELRFRSDSYILMTGASITGPGEVNVTGGTISALNPVEVRVHLAGGTVEGAAPDGEAIFTEGSLWTAGYLDGASRVKSNETMTISGDGALKRAQSLATIEIDGRLLWLGPGSVENYDTVTWTISPSGTLEMAGEGNIFTQFYGDHSLVNQGLIRRTSSSGDAILDDITTVNESGIAIETGRLLVRDPLGLMDGGSITGGGTLIVESSTTTLVGTTTLFDTTFQLAGGTLSSSAGDAGVLSGSNILWTSGYLDGVVTFDGDATVSGPSLHRINSGSELRNAGAMNVTDGSIQNWENSILRNTSNGSLTLGNGVLLDRYYSAGNQFINEGSLAIAPSSGKVTMEYSFVQTATGELRIGVAGSDATSPDFDILQVNSTATIAGTLVAWNESGYSPPVGTEFEVLKSSNRVGTFDSVVAPHFSVIYPTDGDPPVSRHNAVLVAQDSSEISYQDWASINGLTGSDALEFADPDGDGISNWVEYALNMNPNVADVPPIASSVETFDGQNWLVLRYRSWNDRVGADLLYLGEWSPDLSMWSKLNVVDELDPSAVLVTGSEGRLCRVPMDTPKKFLRLDFFLNEFN
ncbi:MAG: hypothetical protein ACSHYB_01635 [Roseibacillus sp.]